jgi:hypothetical protein
MQPCTEFLHNDDNHNMTFMKLFFIMTSNTEYRVILGFNAILCNKELRIIYVDKNVDLRCLFIYGFTSHLFIFKTYMETSMANPFTIYSKNKIYRKIIEISPMLKRYLFTREKRSPTSPRVSVVRGD